ncbi:MAG: diaminopimelate epimerase [Chloroflexi bacterium]|nr:diaminopimelate epimerase [Chloroflexota bacterium]
MSLRFSKWHGLGNDFILTDARRKKRDWPSLAIAMCDRHFGIGADGLILALPSRVARARMRIFNPDGSEAEMCGNGIRCFALFLLEEGILAAGTRPMRVETMAGVQELSIEGEDGVMVRVNMGLPRFDPRDLPVNLPVESYPQVINYPLAVNGGQLDITCVSMGNPHAVAFVQDSVEDYPLLKIGPTVERHPLFPRRTNLEVCRVVDRGHLEVRVWERGAGPTLACGTGACAAVVAAAVHGWVDEAVEVSLPGGVLRIVWDGKGPVYMTGPAVRVFSGEWQE